MALPGAAGTYLSGSARLQNYPPALSNTGQYGLNSAARHRSINTDHTAESSMSKGLDSKKSEKKKPAKTMKEKKVAKQEKKKNSK